MRIINHRMNVFFFISIFPSLPWACVTSFSYINTHMSIWNYSFSHHLPTLLCYFALFLCSLCCFSSCLIRSRPSGTLRYETWHLLLHASPESDKAHKPMHAYMYILCTQIVTCSTFIMNTRRCIWHIHSKGTFRTEIFFQSSPPPLSIYTFTFIPVRDSLFSYLILSVSGNSLYILDGD